MPDRERKEVPQRVPTLRVELPERDAQGHADVRRQVQLMMMRPRLKLQDLDQEQQAVLSTLQGGYERLSELRRAAYTEHLSGMTVPQEMKDWAEAMALTFGPTAQVWVHELPWLEAFAVSQWGEEPSVWPTSFAPQDIERAATWLLNNKWPGGVSRIFRRA